MSKDTNEPDDSPKPEAFRELVMSARVYYRNDKRIDWAEWKHLTNEAEGLGLNENDALEAAREAIGAKSWSPPLAPPSAARGSDSSDGSPATRSGSGANSLEAISLNSTDQPSASGAQLKKGIVINDTYRLEDEIGSGGMGVVWRAAHTKLGTKVAIKFLKRAVDGESAARFLREARMAAQLESPHVARVFDCAQLESGELFIVMEYFEGMGLDECVKREGPLPVERAVDYILEGCVGIAIAHKNDIVHRDLKPANLFLADTESGRRQVKVVDFGLSRLAQPEDGEALTREQILLGTPEYAPPEQFGSAMNAREPADIWALGATLYCLLTGKPPFPKDQKLSGLYQMSDLLKRVTGEPPMLASERRSEVPKDLDKVITKCLQKSADDRYPNVADFALDLATFGSERAKGLAEEVVTTLGARSSQASVKRVSVLTDPDDQTDEPDPAPASEKSLSVPPKTAAPVEAKSSPPWLVWAVAAVVIGVIVIALLSQR